MRPTDDVVREFVEKKFSENPKMGCFEGNRVNVS